MKLPGQYVDCITTALPPLEINQVEGAAFLKEHFRGRLADTSIKLMERVFRHPSVNTRRFALKTLTELVDEEPDKRVARFTHWAVSLSAEAAAGAMRKAGLAGRDISALVVNTCTGYLCPGISTYLVERLGLNPSVKAYDLAGSGCAGAVANLQLAGALSETAPGGAVLSVAVEICSATFQMADEESLIISNALFGDGAAAAVVRNQPGGFALVASASHFVPEYREDVRFIYRHGQLHNQLSLRLPRLAAETVATLTAELLAANNLKQGDISHWAVHPGGENILKALQETMGLENEQLQHSRNVLRKRGNMSSATVWFIMAEIERKGIAPGDLVVMLTFGAGLAAHAYLLRKV